MKILKSRKIAIIITVVIIVAATLFGVHKSLTDMVHDLEDVFYSGSFRDGYKHASIDTQLEKQAEAAMGIVSIAKNYGMLAESAEDLSLGRLALLDAVSIEEKALASRRMGFPVYMDLQFAYLDAGLPDRDNEAFEYYLSVFFGTSEVMRSEGRIYNDAVQKFLDGGSYSAIAGFLKPFAFVKQPELFINYQA